MRTVCELVAGLAITIGCGDSGSAATSAGGNPTGPGGAGGAGASSSDGGNAATGPSGGNGGGGMAPGCAGLLGTPDDCTSCVEAGCCPEIEACVAEPNCNECLNGEDGTGCDFDARIVALEQCTTLSCKSECTPSNACNPVTNLGCDPDMGEACDRQTSFVCYSSPNEVALCGACDSATGPWCVAGTTCMPGTNQCGRYCCDDSDCEPGTCSFDLYDLPDVGICVEQTGGSTPSCDVPVFPPSDGACFMP